MARGNFRANKSWGCTYCGDRENVDSLVAVGVRSNKVFLCNNCLKAYQERQAKKDLEARK